MGRIRIIANQILLAVKTLFGLLPRHEDIPVIRRDEIESHLRMLLAGWNAPVAGKTKE